MSNEAVIQFMSPVGSGDDVQIHEEMHRRLCAYLRVTPEELALLKQALRRIEAVEGRCKQVVARCASLENMQKMACCPANMNYSAITIDKFSHQNQVPVNTPVTNLGAPYVDNYPVNPGSKIRLIQEARPGYSPKKLTIALNLANGGTNYLDIEVKLFVTTDPKLQGEQLGSEYRGFQFFNNEGIPTPIDVPMYKNNPVTVGTQEYLVVEIHHQGAANNLVSAFVAAHVNAEGWYAACGDDNACC